MGELLHEGSRRSASPGFRQVGSEGELRLIAIVGAIFVLASLCILPVAAIPGPAIPAIAAVFAAVVFVADLCTLCLLLQMFGAAPTWSGLLLSLGYTWSAVMALCYLVAFPDLWSFGPLIGSTQTIGLLFAAWILGYPIMILLAVIARIGPEESDRLERARPAAWMAFALLLLLIAGTILAGLWADDWLPEERRGYAYSSWSAVVQCLSAILAGATLVLLLRLVRGRDTLFGWLGLAQVALIAFDVLTLAGGATYSTGWVASRISGVLSACFLLVYFLTRFGQLHRSVAEALREVEELNEVLEQRVAERTADLAEAFDQQAYLMRELDHRANNVLAIVLSLIRLSRTPDLAAFIDAIEGRISAMSRAHSLLSGAKWSSIELDRLACAELAPWLDTGAVRLDGPTVMIEASAAQSLVLALHELATNAAKYGALSHPDGRLSLTWRRGADGTLELEWAESGGPPIASEPARRGFGSDLLERTMTRQMGGGVDWQWRPEGLTCRITLPAEVCGQSV